MYHPYSRETAEIQWIRVFLFKSAFNTDGKGDLNDRDVIPYFILKFTFNFEIFL